MLNNCKNPDIHIQCTVTFFFHTFAIFGGYTSTFIDLLNFSTGICKGKTDGKTLPYVGCRSYWKCQDGVPEPMCCPAGQHYDNKQSKCVVGISSACSGVGCDGAVRASLRKSKYLSQHEKYTKMWYYLRDNSRAKTH